MVTEEDGERVPELVLVLIILDVVRSVPVRLVVDKIVSVALRLVVE